VPETKFPFSEIALTHDRHFASFKRRKVFANLGAIHLEFFAHPFFALGPYAQALMNANPVIPDRPDCYHVNVAFKFLAESIGQSGEAAIRSLLSHGWLVVVMANTQWPSWTIYAAALPIGCN
jgi:hypothetical protein